MAHNAEYHNSQQMATAEMFAKFSELLNASLSNTAARITSDIKTDFKILGSCMEAIELKLDTTVARTNQNTDHIQELHNQLEMALDKIDDLENRTRSYHFRIEGIL